MARSTRLVRLDDDLADRLLRRAKQHGVTMREALDLIVSVALDGDAGLQAPPAPLALPAGLDEAHARVDDLEGRLAGLEALVGGLVQQDPRTNYEQSPR